MPNTTFRQTPLHVVSGPTVSWLEPPARSCALTHDELFVVADSTADDQERRLPRRRPADRHRPWRPKRRLFEAVADERAEARCASFDGNGSRHARAARPPPGERSGSARSGRHRRELRDRRRARAAPAGGRLACRRALAAAVAGGRARGVRRLRPARPSRRWRHGYSNGIRQIGLLVCNAGVAARDDVPRRRARADRAGAARQLPRLAVDRASVPARPRPRLAPRPDRLGRRDARGRPVLRVEARPARALAFARGRARAREASPCTPSTRA